MPQGVLDTLDKAGQVTVFRDLLWILEDRERGYHPEDKGKGFQRPEPK